MTTGINHVAMLTGDLDRLKGFYEDVLGARTLFDLEDNGFRHAMVMVGPESGVHMFQHATATLPNKPQPMFERGRLDHIAITAAHADAFDQIRIRAIALGCECEVVDYGPIVAFNVEDPDGCQIEICRFKPGVDMTAPPPDRAAAAARIGL
jgi:catechol 2,3-dioxygenase-like lactoylglutathione lyase family enzyme